MLLGFILIYMYMDLNPCNLTLLHANNKGADQPEQSDQCLCYLLSGKYYYLIKLATGNFSIF